MFDCYGHQSTQYTAWSGSTNETAPVDIKFELELIDNYLSNVDIYGYELQNKCFILNIWINGVYISSSKNNFVFGDVLNKSRSSFVL